MSCNKSARYNSYIQDKNLKTIWRWTPKPCLLWANWRIKRPFPKFEQPFHTHIRSPAIALQSLTREKKAISPQSAPNQRPLDWVFLKKSGDYAGFALRDQPRRFPSCSKNGMQEHLACKTRDDLNVLQIGLALLDYYLNYDKTIIDITNKLKLNDLCQFLKPLTKTVRW